ncbi:MAG: autotransporter-associated beta strand repeat-containing protein [Pirellulales bacterium]|nr:autotransporter-associated beta strand repeat-containing protein [Pirellulales bacterium]
MVSSIVQDSGNAAFNFGGGTLKAGSVFSTSLPMTLTGTGGNANLDTGYYAVALDGQLSGPGGLNKLGIGMLTLSGENTHVGGTALSAGVLNINHAKALGSGQFTIAGQSTIDNSSGGPITLSTNNPQAWNANFTCG